MGKTSIDKLKRFYWHDIIFLIFFSLTLGLSIKEFTIQSHLSDEQLFSFFLNQKVTFSEIFGLVIIAIFMLALGFRLKDKNEKIAYFLGVILSVWWTFEWSPSNWYKIVSYASLVVNLVIVVNLAF